ncbi:MAG: PQQ-binding-like beta-propeller repeat protein [Candidatus Nealsonbacteria bacterium]|nr:PQQ-binding-like beta-propeller repeat protein [Candidatus Nealsonbacteria bacterium]
MKRPRLELLLCGVLIATVCCLAGSSAFGATSGDEILDAAGVEGGLVVHLGCGDGKLTAALRGNGRYLVHGLDRDVTAARAHIQSLGLYGRVAVDTFDGKRLPYADNMVNLVVAEDSGDVPLSEMIRVLCPNGVAYVQSGGVWQKTVKPWPDTIDQWTHYHHDPQGTMVGRDTTVGPPRRIQWLGGPKWLRNHDFMSSMHAMVSAGGRIFYVIDEGLRNHIFLPARWTLIARDGFNGTILWKKPLEDWYPTNWPLKSGPGHLPRKLVAVGDRVYVAAGLTAPVQAFDAATGRVVATYADTKPTQEIVLCDGVLYLLVDPEIPPVNYRAEGTSYKEIGRANGGWAWSQESPERIVTAIEADSGRLLWKHPAQVAPLTLTIAGDKVLYHNGAELVAIDRKTAAPQWTTAGPSIKQVPTGGSLRVVFSDGVVLLAVGTKLNAFAAEDGKPLWTGSLMKTSHHCPEDLFVIDGAVWSANTGTPQKNGTHFKVMNLHTGEIEKDFVAENLPAFPMHPRCYPSRATTKYIMTNGMGTEFYRLGGNTVDINHTVRGSCIYGIMPSNGLLYKPPDSCACYYQSKLDYLCALAPESTGSERPVPESSRLRKGPAYDAVQGRRPGRRAGNSADWPMYRRDTTRSGSSPSPVDSELEQSWAIRLGGKLTQPVVAGGKVFVAVVDEQTLYALDSDSGDPVWQYTAGGRIDSSPVVHGGTVLFGCADGWAYCLDAQSGALAWRYLVAPTEKRIVSYQQVESAWPVSGSVLIYDDVAYCLAGRNMFFDGGLRLVRLDPTSGRLISETVMDENDPRSGKNLQTLITAKYMPIANADLLSCDGKYVYMQEQKFNLEGKRLDIAPNERTAEGGRHLFCQTGFLDDAWFHRSFWIYGDDCGEGWGAYAGTRKNTPCGRIMVFDDSRVFAFRSEPLGNMLHPRTQYRLYAADKDPHTAAADPVAPGGRKKGRNAGGGLGGSLGGCRVHWQMEALPLLVNAMTLGGKNLFIAGPPDLADETKMLGFLPGLDDPINRELHAQEAAWLGKKGGLLWVVSAADGRKLAEYKLNSFPVFDGMSTARGALYLSLLDGSVVKYGGKRRAE